MFARRCVEALRLFWGVGDVFWSHHPALFLGACVFFGAWVERSWVDLSCVDVVFLCPFFLLISPQRIFFALPLVMAVAFSTFLRVKDDIPRGCSSGTVLAEVLDRRLTMFHKRSLWHMTLYVHDFSTCDGSSIARGISLPVTVAPTCPMVGGYVYEIPASLLVDDGSRIRCRPFFSKELKVVRGTLSCVEWRVHVRRYLERVFSGLFSNESIRHTAGALTFGLYKDVSLQQAMHRAGVEHVLAISGFHFGIVAAITVYCIGFIFSRLRSVIAMVLLTVYLLIVGPLPSVIRAWCSSIIVLGSVVVNRRASGLNCLGVGLIVSILYDPTFAVHIGFQLSFLATSAILFFSYNVLKWLQSIFPVRPIRVLEQFSFPDQVLLGVLHWLIPIFSLLIPVSIMLIPYQMAFLQDFSSLGCLYNLIIPTLFSFAMPPILLAVLFHPCQMLAAFFSSIAEPFLHAGVTLVQNIPEHSWTMVAGGGIPPYVGRMAILVLFFIGMWSHSHDRPETWKACL